MSVASSARRSRGRGEVDVFVTHSIPEVRSLATEMESRITAKSEELKGLVGARYKDLLSAADSVVAMRTLCSTVMDNISQAADRTDALLGRHHGAPTAASTAASTAATAATAAAATTAGDEDPLVVPAVLLSIILSTPELMWGALEVHDFVGGARVYVLAENMVAYLHGLPNAPALAAKFPVLSASWDSVSGFPPLMSAALNDALADLPLGSLLEPPHDAQLWADEAVSALAAHCVLNGASLRDGLVHLLDTRLAAASAHLSALIDASDASGVPPSVDDLIAALVRFALVVDDTVRLVAAVFGAVDNPLVDVLATFGTGRPPSEFAELASALLSSAAAGRSLPLSRVPEPLRTFARTAGGPGPGPGPGPAPLPMDTVRACVTDWLARTAETLASLSAELLDAVGDGPAMGRLVLALWHTLSAAADGAHSSLARSPSLPRSAAQLIAAAGTRDAAVAPWSATAPVVAGRHVDLWAELFVGPLVGRSCELLTDLVAACDIPGLARSLVAGTTTTTATTTTAASTTSAATLRASCGIVDPAVSDALAVFDARLANVLATFHTLVYPCGGTSPVPPPSAHASVLVPQVVSHLEAATAGLVDQVAAVASSMASATVSPDASRRVGMLLRGLVLASTSLPRLWRVFALAKSARGGASFTPKSLAFVGPRAARAGLPDPARTASTRTGSLTAAQGLGHGHGPAVAFEAAVHAAVSVTSAWSASVAHAVSDAFARALEADEWTSRARRAQWPAHPDAPLPVFPSAYVAAALLDLATHIEDAGGSALDSSAAVGLLASVEADLLAAYTDKLDGGSVSDAGACQALFDVHYLRGLIATPAPESTSLAPGWDACVGRLESAIDPVDLVVFAPRIADAVTAHFDRTAVLFGLVAQHASRSRSATSSLGSYVEAQSVVALAPSVSRISELAVALPPSLRK